MSTPKGKAYLLKTHQIGHFYRLRASQIFYSYRDVRTAAVSSLRKFNENITIESIRNKIAQYQIAKRTCDLCIKYEELISNPEYFIQELARLLDIQVDVAHIKSITANLKPPTTGDTYSRETQLHKGHFTHTQDDEWRVVIPNDLQERINEEFSWWFTECGYPLQ